MYINISIEFFAASIDRFEFIKTKNVINMYIIHINTTHGNLIYIKILLVCSKYYHLKYQGKGLLFCDKFNCKGDRAMDKEKIIQYIRNNDFVKARKAIDKVLCLPVLNKTYYVQVIKQAITFIENNYDKKIKLEDVAEYVGFSKEYLSKMFKHNMNMNYRDFLVYLRVRKAESLLLRTNLHIKEISVMVGIDDEGYFTKMFKKVNSCTPYQFRALYPFYYTVTKPKNVKIKNAKKK